QADYIGFLKMERLWLAVVGFYPSKSSNYKYLKNISGIFVFTVAILYIIFAFIHGYLNLRDVTVLSETVTFLMTHLAYVTKIVILCLYRENIFLLEGILRNPVVAELETPREENLVKQNLKYGRLFTNLFKMSAAITVSIHAVYPLIDYKRSGRKNLLYSMWLPFNQYNHYGKVYSFEIILIICTSWLDVTLVALNILLMDLCAIQFKLLKNRLIRISTNFSANYAVDDTIRMQKLRKYIIHQNYVYRCSSLVEETFSVGVFVQIVCGVLVICFGLFKSLVTPLKSMQFAMLATYFITMLYLVTLYCVYGQKILDASNDLTDACYMSKWNNCSLDVQKYLVLIMTRANKPVIMKAGGIFSLSLETLMTIYTSSYSFFTLIWQVYNTDK
ncbi:hypothetical protein NQ315_009582, partial [Exocentrus adspersus]